MPNYSDYIKSLEKHSQQSKNAGLSLSEPIMEKIHDCQNEHYHMELEVKFWKHLEMIYVKGGDFKMGNEVEGIQNVTLTSYAIGKYSVTQFVWKTIMGNNPSKITGEDLPVTNVSYNDIQKFILKLEKFVTNTLEENRYNTNFKKFYGKFDLPTEAQWEFAAKGGNNNSDYYSREDSGWNIVNSKGTLHEVGQKKANVLGIYDIVGNVFEMCKDLMAPFNSGNKTNPIQMSGIKRVIRGGSFLQDQSVCSPITRASVNPLGGHDHQSTKMNDLGFRLVLVNI